MYIAPRSVDRKVFEIWRSPGRFTKNPDLIALPSGRLMLVYADTDAHWSMKNQVLTLLASDDDGRTWFKHREIDEADLTRGDERLVTPRLSLLNDGRLVVICDHDDDGHFHEDQPPGNWLYWSEDQGDTWRAQHDNGIGGFEPDRILDLPDGSLGVVSHLMRGDVQEFAEVLWVSTDGGATWQERATVACDGYHRFCEGAIVLLHGGRRLACVLRENHSGGIPSFVTFSDDDGHNWSAPQKLPFAIHRPYAKQLADGRVMVSGRNVNGGLGTYAWVGDLEAAAGQHLIGGPRRKYSARMEDDALVIENRLEHECRYTLLPPQSSFSEVDFEADLRVEASGDAEVAFLSISRLGVLVTVTPDSVRMQRGRHQVTHAADMRRWRRLRLHHRRGWLRVMLDGEAVFHRSIYREEWPASDFRGGNPLTRTQFGQYGDSGRSFWRSIRYRLGNPTLEDHEWRWDSAEGQLPDQAQRDRLVQIHANHPAQRPMPDHGYSSWYQREDGRIFLVDYTNCGDVPNTCHLVGVYLEAEDLA